MRTSILATIFAFGTVIAVPALAQQSTGPSSQQQMQDEADKGVKTRNSGDSGYVGEQERPGASSHVPGQPDTKSSRCLARAPGARAGVWCPWKSNDHGPALEKGLWSPAEPCSSWRDHQRPTTINSAIAGLVPGSSP